VGEDAVVDMGGLEGRMNWLRKRVSLTSLCELLEDSLTHLKLFFVRVGPGAAVLPRDVTRIHMRYAAKYNEGHFGPRKFWRQYLPRLKYHNPNLKVTVEQTQDQAGPATLTIFYSSETSADRVLATELKHAGAPGGPSAEGMDEGSSVNEKMETVDMKHKHERDIWKRVAELTGAEEIEPTDDELHQIREYEAADVQGEIDRKNTRARFLKQRAEEEFMKRAREGLVV